MDSKARKIEQFDPNSPGMIDGNIFGLPFSFEESNLVVIPVPWDLTASFGRGTGNAPEQVAKASLQVDLYDQDYPDGWKEGFFMLDIPEAFKELNKQLNAKSREIIRLLEAGEDPNSNSTIKVSLEKINEASEAMREWVLEQAQKMIKHGKHVIVLGGDHSSSLGLMQALSLESPGYGILQIDAHADLREAYEGFTLSHASIMYHAMQLEGVSKLVQTGIRDVCEEEMNRIDSGKHPIDLFTDRYIKDAMMEGRNFSSICDEIVDCLPEKVYISLDVDGLEPSLCPNTGTPVPGGFTFEELEYLLRKVVDSGRSIIGADICETGDHPWDANVSARLLFKLSNLICLSAKA